MAFGEGSLPFSFWRQRRAEEVKNSTRKRIQLKRKMGKYFWRSQTFVVAITLFWDFEKTNYFYKNFY